MLDVSIRIGILNLMLKLKEEREIAFLYVTHDLASARYVADDILVMYAGQIVEQGPIEQVLADPLHPYTRLLLSAVPDPAAGLRPKRIEVRKGLASAAVDPADGLPLRRPLPARDRRLLARHARARRGAPGQSRALPRHRPDRAPRGAHDRSEPAFPPTSSGAPPRRRTRSRAPRTEDGRGESVWDRFCATPGQGAERRHAARSPATSTTAIPRTSR